MTRDNGIKSFALVAALFLLLSWLRLDPGAGGADGPSSEAVTEEVATTGDENEFTADVPGAVATDEVSATAGSAGSGTRGGGGGGAAAGRVDPRGLECKPGKNGNETDVGVSGSKIRLATTAVLDGPARSLLSDSPNAMKAVVDKVNRSGGVCGRLLELTVVNDSFRDSDGQRIIRNFIAEKYFALPVVPSAEGLGAAIRAGLISKAGIPVVGTDGLRQEQYEDPWVWPVASATVTSMRVMAKYGATARNAKSFAIVWDNKYKFGEEGKDAFVNQVKAMFGPNAKIVDQPLDPDVQSYASEAEAFNRACGSAGENCDMVAMLLLPDTAKKWLQRKPVRGGLYTAGAQTLFTDQFARDCVQMIGADCHGFAVWTGYNPPTVALPGVVSYVNDVRAVKPDIDVNNQFVEGAYLGMSMFVEALHAVGPNLTRARLKAVLDGMDYKTDLASTLTWRPGNHFANVRSQAFSMTVNQGAFRGWTSDQTGFLLDPARG